MRFDVVLLLLTLTTAPLATAQFGGGFSGRASTYPVESRKPNIVFILTDDQAPWAFGQAIREGQFANVPIAQTPNLDRLAAEGVRFTNFFCVAPVCSPARAAIATGRYASEFGIEDFIPAPDHKLFDAKREVALDPADSETFADVLKNDGYQTALIGKWHLGDWTRPGHAKYHPTNHGYDHFMGLLSGGTSPDNPILEIGGKTQQVAGLTIDILTDEAIRFIKQAAQNPEPFLLCLHTRAPHGRWLPVAPEDWQPYADLDPQIPDYDGLDEAKMKKSMREYLASTTGVDRNVGRLLQTIDDLEITEHTAVIFTSDHGYNMGHNGIWHKGNGIWATKQKPPGQTHHGTRVISDKYRPNMYDLSLRVPAVIRWPGRAEAGLVVTHTASHLDLFPTILSMGHRMRRNDLMRSGRDLTPLLRGEEPSEWDEDLYAEYSMIHYATATMRCYRTPRHKLIRDFHNDGRDEFFDLQADPDEAINLIDSDSPEVQAAIANLSDKLLVRMSSIGDPLASRIPTGDKP